MKILALETTSDLCSLAIRDAQGTLVERAFRHRMRLSERLIGDVEALLADAGLTLPEIEGLAVGLGPGSFTGVRIGVMTVKTWADVLSKPVCGVSALDAIAAEYAGLPETVIASMIRARPGSVYLRLYRSEGEELLPLSEPEALPLEALASRLVGLAAPRVLLCGEGLVRGRPAIETALRALPFSLAFGRPDPPRASTVAALAAARFAAGAGDDPLKLVPLYIAPPPINPSAAISPKKIASQNE